MRQISLDIIDCIQGGAVLYETASAIIFVLKDEDYIEYAYKNFLYCMSFYECKIFALQEVTSDPPTIFSCVKMNCKEYRLSKF